MSLQTANVSKNLGRLSLTSLRLVILCADNGSLSKAANLAAVSLSCASHRLHSLEELLGQQIFLRTNRGLQPSEEGLAVIVQCRMIVELAQELIGIPGAFPPRIAKQGLGETWLQTSNHKLALPSQDLLTSV